MPGHWPETGWRKMSTLRKRRTSRPLKLDVRRIRLHLATNDRETGREPSDCLGCEIWVQLGCNKNSRGLLEAPKVAIGAVKLQLVTSERCLSRQRSRVRVSSSPPFFLKNLPKVLHFRVDTKRHKIGTGNRAFPSRAYVSCVFSRNKSATTASCALRFSVVTACV